ncbi:MAG: hypothetical protein ACKN9T_04310 [Candidatus Methylumidiphilus sp.]
MNHRNTAPTLLIFAAFLALAGCGKSEPEQAAKPATSAEAPKYNDNLDHQAFEKKYADMCVNQELALRKQEHPNSGNAGVADEGLSTLCNCIAREESKRLTKAEARKFVQENEYPMSLMIKAGQAEEACAKK